YSPDPMVAVGDSASGSDGAAVAGPVPKATRPAATSANADVVAAARRRARCVGCDIASPFGQCRERSSQHCDRCAPVGRTVTVYSAPGGGGIDERREQERRSGENARTPGGGPR